MTWKVNVGSMELYGIPDGQRLRDPAQFLLGSAPSDWEGFEHFLTPDGLMVTSYSCFLVDTGTTLVLIDTGFGPHGPDDEVGHMPGELKRLGISPDDISHVVFTHLHPDHILGALDASDSPFFGNATHWTVQRERDFWLAGEDERSQLIQRFVSVMEAGDLLQANEQPGGIVDGIEQVATFGHTPGHTSIRVASGTDSIVITGDLTWNPMHILRSDWTFPADVDPNAAVDTRRRFFADMAASGTPFAAGHHDQPGLARLTVGDDGARVDDLPVEFV